MLHFYENIRTNIFFLDTHFDRNCVCNPAVCNGNFSLSNYVGYNKFLFHGQYIALSKPLPRFGYLAS